MKAHQLASSPQMLETLKSGIPELRSCCSHTGPENAKFAEKSPPGLKGCCPKLARKSTHSKRILCDDFSAIGQQMLQYQDFGQGHNRIGVPEMQEARESLQEDTERVVPSPN